MARAALRSRSGPKWSIISETGHNPVRVDDPTRIRPFDDRKHGKWRNFMNFMTFSGKTWNSQFKPARACLRFLEIHRFSVIFSVFYDPFMTPFRMPFCRECPKIDEFHENWWKSGKSGEIRQRTVGYGWGGGTRSSTTVYQLGPYHPLPGYPTHPPGHCTATVHPATTPTGCSPGFFWFQRLCHQSCSLGFRCP